MNRNSIIYSYPFAVDIMVALLLFVGRHSLASRGLGEETVGSILFCYGGGYCLSSLFMRKIVRVSHARWQMVAALAAAALASSLLASLQQIQLIQILFCLIPFAVSLFFNAFQAFMLDVSHQNAKPLAATAGHYTFSWSMGFALGSLAPGVFKGRGDSWEEIYYLAALIAAGVAVLVFLVKPTGTTRGDEEEEPSIDAVYQGGRSLIGPAWLGLMLGGIGWNIFSTYWPVQATQLSFSASVKGVVEFAIALSQSLAALALIYLRGWHHRPLWLLLFGLVGSAALLVFGNSSSPLLFISGAMLFGVYMSSIFIFMVYHAMFDKEKAVKRISMNETFVGLSFLIGPVIAALLHRDGEPFAPVYVLLAFLLAVGVSIQTIYARRLIKAGDSGRIS